MEKLDMILNGIELLKETVGDISHDMAEMKDTIYRLGEKVDELGDRVESLERKMDELGEKVESLERKTDELGGKVESLEKKTDELGGKVESLEEKTDEVGEKVESLEKKTDELGGKVESLEKKFRNTARLSFSTKITDYLRSGKCIFAIGDKDIAPIDYFNRYDSAVTASSYEQISEKVTELVNTPDLVLEYAKKAYDCGVEHHERSKMDELLVSCIVREAKGVE